MDIKVKTEIDAEDIIWIRKTIPLEDWTDEMLQESLCSSDSSYGVKKSEVKEFLKKHPELIERNKDQDLSAYL